MEFGYHASNHDRRINNPQFINSVAKNISARLGRRMTQGERQYLTTFVRELNPRMFAGKDLRKVASVMTDIFTKKLNELACDEAEVDTRELLKGQIGVSSEMNEVGLGGALGRLETKVAVGAPIDVLTLFGQNSPSEIQKFFNPDARLKKNYLVLDSRYRTLENDGTRFFKWDHVNNLNRAQGTVNTVGHLRDIVAIKVFPVRIPYASGADNDLRRVTALFDEFSAQSFIGHENRRFHVAFESKVDGGFIDLDAYRYNDGTFHFRKPVTQFNSFTLTFGSPLEEVVFDPDRMSSTLTDAAVTVITTSADHNLSSGNRVYIENYSTTNPGVDAFLMSQVNKSHIITKLSNTTFSIPVDTSSVNVALTGTVGVTVGDPNVTGVGTLFTSELSVGDTIRIVDSLLVERTFTVLIITDDTNLILSANYSGTLTEAGLDAFHDNRVVGLSFNTYFDSKRFFMTIEVTFIDPS